MKIVFGTDGWRARIAEEYTFDAVRVCAQAVAEWVQQSGEAGRGVVIGFDRRFASEHFAAAAAEVRVLNAEDIGIALNDKFPEVDPLTVRFTDLRERVLQLEGFDDDPKTSNEPKLEAIQMAWYEEWKENHQDSSDV